MTLRFPFTWSSLATRRLLTGGLLMLAATACASDPLTAAPAAPETAGPALAGNYLAGRHALTQRDAGTAATMLLKAIEQDPQNDTLRGLAFIALMRDGRVSDAEVLARDLINTREQAEISQLTLAVTALARREAAASLSHIRALEERNVYRFLLPLLDAWAQLQGGNADKAIEALAPLRKREGFEVLVTLHEAMLLDQAGRATEADQAFAKLHAQQADLSLHVIQVLGAYWQRRGLTDKARDVYQGYLKRQPATDAMEVALQRLTDKEAPPHVVSSPADGAGEALMGIASALSQQGAEETAELFVRLALHLKADFPTAQLLLAGLMEADKRFEAANQVYQGINPNAPLSLTAKVRQADNLDNLNRTDEAIAILKDVARMRPADPKPMLDLGDILRRHKRFSEAAESYEEGLERIGVIRERHWPVLYTQGIALERSGDWDRAEDRFLKALAFKPDQPLVLNYLGYSWVERHKNLKQAEDMIRKAVSLRPSDGYIVDSLGWVMYRLGRFDEAVKELERAVELRAEDPVINDHLGDAYWKVGRKREAVFQWKRVLGLEPDADVEASVREKLKHGLKE